MKKRIAGLSYLIAMTLMVGPIQGDSIEVGAEFQANVTTEDNQTEPSVATAPNGDFIVAWRSPAAASIGTDPDVSIHAQRFASDGSKIGDEFQANEYTTGSQYEPSVAFASDGSFVIAWTGTNSSGSDNQYRSVQVGKFDSAGNKVGQDFQVNEEIQEYQEHPEVAALPDNSFLVVWESSHDFFACCIQARRVGSDGMPIGAEFSINNETSGNRFAPSIGSNSAGDLVVAWTEDSEHGNDTAQYSVWGRRLASDGTPLGTQFQVNTYTPQRQQDPSVAVAPSGDFVVTWNNSFMDVSIDFDVRAQLFSSTGALIGAEVQVNTYTTEGQFRPKVTAGPEGDWLVMWDSRQGLGSEPFHHSIMAQRYGPDSAPIGGEFQVNDITTAGQSSPSLATDADGNVVAVWVSGPTDDDPLGTSLRAQRLSFDILFQDGFESGDVLTWSDSVP